MMTYHALAAGCIDWHGARRLSMRIACDDWQYLADVTRSMIVFESSRSGGAIYHPVRPLGDCDCALCEEARGFMGGPGRCDQHCIDEDRSRRCELEHGHPGDHVAAMVRWRNYRARPRVREAQRRAGGSKPPEAGSTPVPDDT